MMDDEGADKTSSDGWSIDWMLSLNRQRVGLDNGYWWTIRATQVECSEERPHGLKYAISLHDDSGDRVLGFDNAHAIDVATGPAKRSRRPKTWDHKHERDKASVPYMFESPAKLLEDFFEAMNAYLEKEGQS